MDWAVIAGIIAKEGLDIAEAVFNKWQSGEMPTAQDFADLRALGKITPEDLVKQAAAMVGLEVDHPKVQALLALVNNPIALVNLPPAPTPEHPPLEPPPPPAA